MLARRHRGFTLIELLVVIAIIGILAAMLFPVFARARESARKTQCLANVKNIAIAYQMYLTDYDKFMPSEHDANVIDYFNGGGPNEGCGCGDGRACCTDRVAQANPFLKVPVILDDYTKNRDIWKCPSAPRTQTFSIMDPTWNSQGREDWFLTFQEAEDNCPRFRSCDSPFPKGWGGAVTDTRQGGVWCTPDPGTGAFEQTIGIAGGTYDMSTSAINDSAKRYICGDGGINHVTGQTQAEEVAYPDTCRLTRVACDSGCGGDWENCDQSRTCSPPRNDLSRIKWALDPNTRKTLAKSRHLGGSNLGFADGHAKWMPSEQILFGGEKNWRGFGDNSIEGLTTCFYPGPLEW